MKTLFFTLIFLFLLGGSIYALPGLSLMCDPTPTQTNIFTPTETGTATPLPTETSTVTPLPTDTPIPTATPLPTDTPTSTPTPTDMPTSTLPNTSTTTVTDTPAITPSPTGTNTNTPFHTITPTNVFTPTPESSQTPTLTKVASITPRILTETPTNTPTSTKTKETKTPTPLPPFAAIGDGETYPTYIIGWITIGNETLGIYTASQKYGYLYLATDDAVFYHNGIWIHRILRGKWLTISVGDIIQLGISDYIVISQEKIPYGQYPSSSKNYLFIATCHSNEDGIWGGIEVSWIKMKE
jgi:hypothetical protein